MAEAIPVPRKDTLSRYFKRNWTLHMLLVPAAVYLFVFMYIPMYGVLIAFKDFRFNKGILGSDWIGFDNFRILFEYDFTYVLSNSLILSLYDFAVTFPMPILLALLLNEVRHIAFKRVSQTIVYLPHFISWVVIAGIVSQLLQLDGPLNAVVAALGGERRLFLLEPSYFRSIVVFTEAWKEAGWGTIIYLAAISTIDPQQYEAAVADGANRLQRAWYVTLPGIRSAIVVLLILRIGRIMNNGFEPVFLLHNSLTLKVADVFELYTYRVGLLLGRFGYATAVGLFKNSIGLILIIGTNYLIRRMGGRALW